MLGMESAAGEHVLLPGSVSTLLVVLLALVALAAWLAAHFLVRRPELRAGRVAFFVIRAAIGSGTVWLLLNVMARFLVLGT